MELLQKLSILADAAKYDVACTSSGADKTPVPGGIGSAAAAGICHTFTADGRCVSLLKVLLSNACIHDCRYCLNRRSNDVPRATFTAGELAELTMQFYRRNYIEGLFLSSGVVRNADYTVEQMIRVLRILREKYWFCGYIHAKAIPGADPRLIWQLGLLADRLSVNIELPSAGSLRKLAPGKSREMILLPMRQIGETIAENREDIVRYRHAPRFAPAGQSTQMIVGASPEPDRQILHLAESLYQKYGLKRVFFSAYIPLNDDPALPGKGTPPPLLREHRLYQADWLLRFYGFTAGELLDERHPDFDPLLDPKESWAVAHPEFFPGGGQLRPPGGAPAGAGHRAAVGQADSGGQTVRKPRLRGAETHRGGHPPGAVLRYLPGEASAAAGVQPRFGAAGPHQPGKKSPGADDAAGDGEGAAAGGVRVSGRGLNPGGGAGGAFPTCPCKSRRPRPQTPAPSRWGPRTRCRSPGAPGRAAPR